MLWALSICSDSGSSRLKTKYHVWADPTTQKNQTLTYSIPYLTCHKHIIIKIISIWLQVILDIYYVSSTIQNVQLHVWWFPACVFNLDSINKW